MVSMFPLGRANLDQVLRIAPAALLTVGTALSAPPLLVLSAPHLLLTIWLHRKNAGCIRKHGLAADLTAGKLRNARSDTWLLVLVILVPPHH